MNSTDECIEQIAFLTRSATRARILRELQREGSLRIQELRDRFDCDRTTLQRNLAALTEHGWIQQDSHTVRITQAGELMAADLSESLETARTAMKLRPLLQQAQTDELDLDPAVLADATVLSPDPGDPYAMINRQVELVRQADENHGFLRVTGLHAAEAGHEMVTNGGRAEFVVTPDIAETWLTKPAYAEKIEEMLDTGRLHVYEYPDELPFSLVVIDDIVQITVDEDGDPTALVETDDDDARAWADQLYEKYRQQAEPVP